MKTNIEQVLMDCLKLGAIEDAPAWVLSMKLGEEYGEFCEAALKELGYLRHKQLKENSFGEAADIINTLLATLQKLWPNMSDEILLGTLAHYIEIKRQKYEMILKDSNK